MSAYANWSPLFKERYGDFINPLPSEDSIASEFTFVTQDQRPGVAYNFPIKVRNEGGITFNTDGTAFTLNAAIDSVWQNARLDGATIMVTGNLPYDVSAKSMNGAGSGSRGGAFVEALDQKVEAIMETAELTRELSVMYGTGTAAAAAANLGAVSASVSGANMAAPQVVNITRATWAPGVWNQIDGFLVDVYQSDGSTLRENNVTVSAPDPTQNRITLTKVGSTATAATGDIIVLAGQRTKCCYGLQAILENTGTLFGISASTYRPWRAVSFGAGSATLTRAKIGQFASRIFPNGLRSGGSLFCSGSTFADLGEECDALVQWTASDGNSPRAKRQGTNRIMYTSQIGTISVVNHIYMKQSLAWFVGHSQAGGSLGKRVGSTDVTFALPGTKQWFYSELSGAAGSQLRAFSNQAPVLEVPYHCGYINAISNNSDTSPA